MNTMSKVRLGAVALNVLFFAAAHASPIQISVLTSSFAGTDAVLAFDFNDGGPPSNSATITGSVAGGTFGTASITHDLVAFDPAPTLSAGVTLDDSQPFTEYQQPVTLGTSLTFTIDATNNAASPAPDALAFLLLDADAFLPLVPTSDALGALFRFTLGEPDQPERFTADGITVAVVPEPGALALVSLALFAAAATRRSKR